MKKLALIVCVALAGCMPVGASKSVSEDHNYPAGTQRIVAPGNHIAWVMPIQMADGTSCVLVVKNGAGTAISCDFK